MKSAPPLQKAITAADMEMEILNRELCRRRYRPFVERMTPRFKGGWHVDKMAEIVEKINYAIEHPEDESLCRRFIITMPPRHMKSQNMARCGPLWLLGRHPWMEILVGTYASDLAEEHGSWCKNAAKDDPLFKTVFPKLTLNKDSQAKSRMGTPEGGGMRFVGRQGGTTGRGAHLFVIDDPIKDAIEADSETIMNQVWKWYWSVCETRLAPGGVVVVMHTRWRTNDLIGRLCQMDAESDEKEWEILDLPLIAEEDEYDDKISEILGERILLRKKGETLHPARFNQRWAEKLKKRMAAAGETRDFLALYQQNPVDEEGNFFKRDSINLYKPHELPTNLNVYMAGDFAVSVKEERDFTCIWPYGVDCHHNIYFFPDFVHGRLDTKESVDAMLDLYIRYKPLHVEIEAGVIRSALDGVLAYAMPKKKCYPHIISPNPEGDKRRRAQSIRGMMSMGKVFFPDIMRFHMLCMPEIIAFDKGAHDDIIDTIAMAGRCIAEQVVPLPEDDERGDWDADEDDAPELPSATQGRFPGLKESW